MRTITCSRDMIRSPLTEPAPVPTMPRLRHWRQRRPRRTAPARPQPCHPRGRCRLLQWLRAGNPRAEQCVLRSRTVRAALRRFAAPRRCAHGDGPVTKNMREALERTYQRHPIRNGLSRWAIARSTAACSPAAMRASAACRRRAGRSAYPRLPAAPDQLLKGLLALLEPQRR